LHNIQESENIFFYFLSFYFLFYSAKKGNPGGGVEVRGEPKIRKTFNPGWGHQPGLKGTGIKGFFLIAAHCSPLVLVAPSICLGSPAEPGLKTHYSRVKVFGD
jgi:hypothetical protein